MHPILADSIDGGILVTMVLFGGVVTSVLALIALFPAKKGNRTLTLCLSIPALIMGMVATVWLAWQYYRQSPHDSSSEIGFSIIAWMILAGPALLTGLLALTVLWIKRDEMRPDSKASDRWR
jgi:hypothetical protein